MSKRAIFGAGTLALFLLTGISAVAQTDQTQAQGQGQVVANEKKNVGDWLVRCFPGKSAAPCDMLYVLAFKKTGEMLLYMRMQYAPAQDKQLLTIGVPLNVSFARGVVVTTDSGATQPMPFGRCDRSGCYVSSLIENAAIDAIERSPAAKTKVVFAGATGKVATLPFPLNGFAEARKTMVDLAKGRASTDKKS